MRIVKQDIKKFYLQTFTIASPNTGFGTIYKGSSVTTYPISTGGNIGDSVTGKNRSDLTNWTEVWAIKSYQNQLAK